MKWDLRNDYVVNINISKNYVNYKRLKNHEKYY